MARRIRKRGAPLRTKPRARAVLERILLVAAFSAAGTARAEEAQEIVLGGRQRIALFVVAGGSETGGRLGVSTIVQAAGRAIAEQPDPIALDLASVDEVIARCEGKNRLTCLLLAVPPGVPWVLVLSYFSGPEEAQISAI